jgi:hypothetical protein
VQNADPSAAGEVRARFYDLDGRLTYDLPRPVAPGAATNFYLPQIERDAGLVPQSYALIITADRPVAAISRTENRESGAALLYSNIAAARQVVVPLVMKAFAGQNSLVTVQNTDPGQPAQLRLEFFRSGEPTPVKQLSVGLAPAASTVLDFVHGAELADLPDGFVGWLRVSADLPVTAQASLHVTASDAAVAAYEGQPLADAAERLWVPLVRRNWFGTTGIAVVNPSVVGDVAVTANYRGTAGSCVGQVFRQGPVQLAAAGSAVFYQGAGSVPLTGESPLPAGCAGVAEITAIGGGVLATVVDRDGIDRPRTAAAYNALADTRGARRLAAPLIRNHHTAADLVTGIQVLNVADAAPAQVRLRFFDSDGKELAGGADHSAVIPAGSAVAWYLPAVSVVGARRGLYGSALVDSDQPVVAVITEVSLNGGSDSAAYTAIPVDGPDAPTPLWVAPPPAILAAPLSRDGP